VSRTVDGADTTRGGTSTVTLASDRGVGSAASGRARAGIETVGANSSATDMVASSKTVYVRTKIRLNV
jgi:hypothetical protein